LGYADRRPSSNNIHRSERFIWFLRLEQHFGYGCQHMEATVNAGKGVIAISPIVIAIGSLAGNVSRSASSSMLFEVLGVRFALSFRARRAHQHPVVTNRDWTA
jgi:hypothetical protein